MKKILDAAHHCAHGICGESGNLTHKIGGEWACDSCFNHSDSSECKKDMESKYGSSQPEAKAIKDIAIIPNQIGGSEIQTINARELHEFLGVQTPFSTWIKRRINEYGFMQDIDFTALQNCEAVKSNSYGQDKIEYHISLDMAKHLCMVERTDKGREARTYFIECEKRYKQLADNPLSALDILAQQVAILQKQEREMLAMKQTQDAQQNQIDKQSEKINAQSEKLHEIESKVIILPSVNFRIGSTGSPRFCTPDHFQVSIPSPRF